jgi:hypothetical protein
VALFIAYPWAAGVVAAAFALLWLARRLRYAPLAAVAWASYCVYEYLMYERVLCSGECNIRVDLLFIYPVLVTLSFFGFVGIFRPR